jgi:hypothetical protein
VKATRDPLSVAVLVAAKRRIKVPYKYRTVMNFLSNTVSSRAIVAHNAI